MLEKLRRVAVGLEQRWIARQHLFAGVAGEGREGRVDVQDAALGIGDDDPFLGVLEYARRQPELLLGALAFGDVGGDAA